MFELCTLGTIDLRASDGPAIREPVRRSKRIALLAYLAAPHPVRLHRRETLVALLWPDLDESHGRGALRHELYELRRLLGPDAFQGDGGEAVGVDGARVWCDARAFEEAIEQERLTDALELVRGPFLPGLHVSGGEFERWLDGARDRLGRRAASVADRLSARAERSGDVPAAVRWARRWTELAAYDEVAWRRLLGLLDRVGDRAGALSSYDVLAAFLREELEVEPAPETRALAERIRDRAIAVPVPEAGADGAGEPGLQGATAGPVGAPTAFPDSTPTVIVLRPAENLTGDPRHDVLCRRLTDRLARGISELAYIEVVVGTRASWATAEVSTALYGRDGRIEACPRVTEVGRDGRVLPVPDPVLLDPDPADRELDEVVARVLASVAAQYDPRIPIAFVHGVPVRTPTWKAWLEFIQGTEAFGAFRFEEAALHLRRANEIDPKFVKAGVFAAIALAYQGDPAGAERLTRESLRTGEATASDYERHFATWLLAELRGRRSDAYRACRELVALTTHPVLVFLMGREAYWLNRPAEAVRHLEGANRGQGWWRNWLEYFPVVGGALHLLGAHHTELESALGARATHPERLEPFLAEVRARAALGEARAALDAVEESLTLAPGMLSPADVAWTAAQELETHGHGDAAVDARRAGVTWLESRPDSTQAEHALEARFLLESGDVAGAADVVAGLVPFEDLESAGVTGLVAATGGDAETACGVIDGLEGLENPYLAGRHLLHAAGIRAALGQLDLALETLRRAFAAGLPFGVELHALPMLRPLSAHPELEALLRPRG
jgi:DNA-binding SARP family transcriptional activator